LFKRRTGIIARREYWKTLRNSALLSSLVEKMWEKKELLEEEFKLELRAPAENESIYK
jgi:hypothetical protein